MAQPQRSAQSIGRSVMKPCGESVAVYDLFDWVMIKWVINNSFEINLCFYVRPDAITLGRAVRTCLQPRDIQRLVEMKYECEVLRRRKTFEQFESVVEELHAHTTS